MLAIQQMFIDFQVEENNYASREIQILKCSLKNLVLSNRKEEVAEGRTLTKK